MDKRTRQLTISYLAVIMTLSIIFSFIIYGLVSDRLNRPLPPQANRALQAERIPDSLQERIDRRDRETKQSVIVSLALLNLTILLGGTVLSYGLARKTLSPIEASIRQQERFVSDASHELRTPLTSLLLSNEIALKKKSLKKDEVQQLLLTNIKQVESLRQLTNSLLELSTQQTNESPQLVDIREVVDKIVKTFELQAKEKNISFTTKVDSASITLHPSALSQILSIYIDNALKYSPKKSTVVISSTDSKKSFSIHVEDQGIGIPKDKQKVVFERFYRADTSRTENESSGYGLGLSIATEVARSKNYHLDVSSDGKKGSVFSVTLPK